MMFGCCRVIEIVPRQFLGHWSPVPSPGPSQRKNSALDSLAGYIVWGCWKLKRKFRSTSAGSPPWFQHLYQSQVTVPSEGWNETDVAIATGLCG
jgi:hypothetical protein